jgi:hypothetical protein
MPGSFSFKCLDMAGLLCSPTYVPETFQVKAQKALISVNSSVPLSTLYPCERPFFLVSFLPGYLRLLTPLLLCLPLLLGLYWNGCDS